MDSSPDSSPNPDSSTTSLLDTSLIQQLVATAQAVMPELLPFEVAIGRNAIFQILGDKRGKCENPSSRSPKGTSFRENSSFDVQIVKIGPLW